MRSRRRRPTGGYSPARSRWTTCCNWHSGPTGRRVVRWPPTSASRRPCASAASARCCRCGPRSMRWSTLGRARYNRCPHPTSDRDRCTVNQPVVEPATPLAAVDLPPPEKPVVRSAGAPWWLLLLTAALGAAALWMAWQTSQRVQSLEQELVRRQQESGTLATEARVLARQAQDASRDAVAKVALLESRVAENTVQRTQLEDLLQSMTRSRDENMLSDIEAALRGAVQQAAITGSTEPLLATLKQADERLARNAQPRLERVRRAVVHDLDRVRAVAVSDISTLVIKVDDAVRMVDDLPLLVQPERRGGAAADAKARANTVPAAASAAAAAAAGSWRGELAARWDLMV